MAGILLILAHPDDESFVGGGILSYYEQRGIKTTLLTMTDGQAGRAGLTGQPPLTTRENLGAFRRKELHNAANVFNISNVITPGWPDGSLSDIPFEQGVQFIQDQILHVNPKVIITFGIEGAGNSHPDHIATSKWALEAFDCLNADPKFNGNTPQKLYWITWPEFLRPVDDIEVEGAPVTTIIEIGDEILKLKFEAFAQHETQQDFLERFTKIQDAHGSREYLHLVRPKVNRGNEIESDIFEGIEI
jgi:LmbE family N-acetylglucosaminyl deacetylase